MCQAKQLQDLIESNRKALADSAKDVSAFNPVTIAHRQSEIAIAASQLAEISTGRLVKLTWALIVLTAALLVFTVYLYKDTHALIQRESAASPHEKKHP